MLRAPVNRTTPAAYAERRVVREKVGSRIQPTATMESDPIAATAENSSGGDFTSQRTQLANDDYFLTDTASKTAVTSQDRVGDHNSVPDSGSQPTRPSRQDKRREWNSNHKNKPGNNKPNATRDMEPTTTTITNSTSANRTKGFVRAKSKTTSSIDTTNAHNNCSTRATGSPSKTKLRTNKFKTTKKSALKQSKASAKSTTSTETKNNADVDTSSVSSQHDH